MWELNKEAKALAAETGEINSSAQRMKVDIQE
jgi:hypothetical protein